MTGAKESGNIGEQTASRYLQDCGYQILAVNWRFKRWEADIIAKDGDVLVFVEVKTRSSLAFGYPDEFVDDKKRKNLRYLAEAYLRYSGYQGEIRFDIVSVYKREKLELQHIKDAFWHY